MLPLYVIGRTMIAFAYGNMTRRLIWGFLTRRLPVRHVSGTSEDGAQPVLSADPMSAMPNTSGADFRVRTSAWAIWLYILRIK